MKIFLRKTFFVLACLAAAAAIFTSVLSVRSGILFAAEPDSFLAPLVDYSEIGDPEDLVSAHHRAMNEEMNRRITLFLDAKPEELARMERLPPKIDGRRDSARCPAGATSTWCLSQKMLSEHYAFRRQMIAIRNDLFGEAQDKIRREEGALSIERSGELFASVRALDSFIEQELGYAQKTMDLALAAYNELHIAYPLHLKFNELIDSLEDYRDAISDVRREIDLFPATFFNVQTSKCF